MRSSEEGKEQVETQMVLVQEFVEYSLEKVVSSMKVANERVNGGYIPIEVTKDIMFQLMVGLDTLHLNGIVHRDIKTPNILLKENGKIKIADFGLAKQFNYRSKRKSTHLGTVTFLAPEHHLGDGQYVSSMDVWAAGCVFAELLSK
jgi:serine/threonine protein kinase